MGFRRSEVQILSARFQKKIGCSSLRKSSDSRPAPHGPGIGLAKNQHLKNEVQVLAAVVPDVSVLVKPLGECDAC
jgi:hypothetical protein